MDAHLFNRDLENFCAWHDCPERIATLEYLDEILVRCCQRGVDAAARWQLLLRHERSIRKLLNRLAAQEPLGAEHLEDAYQEAVFWTIEAIARFDWSRFAEPGALRFRHFLRVVIRARFANFLRRERRWQRHDRRANLDDCKALSSDVSESPSAALESSEKGGVLAEAVRRLPELLGEVATGVCAGRSLRELAQVEHVSYRTIKRRWRQSRELLASELRDFVPPQTRSQARTGQDEFVEVS